MKQLSILILILFFTLNLFSKEYESNIQFLWGILHRDERGIIKFLDLNDDIKLKKNDYFKFYLHPNKNTYLYLLYFSAEGDLTILFPETIISDKNQWGFNSEVYIPESDEWLIFSLQNPKEADIVYLLASNKQIKELDLLIKKYLNYQNKNISDNPLDIKNQIIQTIKLKIKENSEFLTYSIKPISTAGGTRSKTIKGYYEQVNAKDFYARVFKVKY